MNPASDQRLEAYSDWLIRRRGWVMVAALLLTVLAGSGMRHLEFSNNYRVFFSPSNPELQAFERFQDTYTKNDNVLLVLQPRQGDVFTPRLAAAVERITEAAWQIPFAIRVDSISNFQHTWADGDELTVEALIRDGERLAPAELADKRAIALAEPLLNGSLISPDADTVGVNITIQYPEQDDASEVPAVVNTAREIVRQFSLEYPDLKIALTGLSPLNNAFAEAGKRDAATLVPLMYGLLLLMLVFALRSASGTLATVLVMAMSMVIAMGLAGHLGIRLTPISVTAPTIIMTLAIADSVHLLVSMFALMREGRDKLAALKESLRINFVAIGITSLTTVVGFLSLNFSDAPPFWHLGNITAMGIIAAWVLSLSFLPALISMLPVRPRGQRNFIAWSDRRLQGLAEFVIARRRQVLAVSTAATLAMLAMIPTLELDDQFVRYFDRSIPFRAQTEFAMENLAGIYIIEYSLPAAGAGAVSDPEYLRNLATFTDWLRAQEEVDHVYSYSDIIKRLNKNMHGDDADYYALPENRELAAQYLLLYELSLPYGLDLNDRINIDKSASRITVILKDISTRQVRDFLAESEQWLSDNAPAYMQARATSAAVMFAYISQRNIESMLRGNAVAVIAIALILIIMLRSWKLGLLSMVPNALPILMTFGAWAILVGQVGMAAATVSATSLGIVVDDTVHFLSKYLRARREQGLGAADAVRYAFRMVGTAITVTTLVLVVGFSVLTLSTFLVNFQMGLLTAMAVLFALILDFLLLPALLLTGARAKETSHAGMQGTVN